MANQRNGDDLLQQSHLMGGALARAKFMGYPSRHYQNSMANSYYSNKFYNNVVPARDVVSKAKFQEF
jgi:hypothetical protein